MAIGILGVDQITTSLQSLNGSNSDGNGSNRFNPERAHLLVVSGQRSSALVSRGPQGSPGDERSPSRRLGVSVRSAEVKI